MGLCNTTLKFDLVEAIGSEGKNSTVYKAFDPQLSTILVVKKVLKSAIIEDYESIDESNFFNESKILYEVKHPHIAEIQYASEDDEAIYFSMPFYKNGSLNKLLNDRFLTVREILKYSLEFLSGLHFIHTKQLIHFDIKPTNILIDNNKKAVITDFGLSKYIDTYGLASPNKLYSEHIPPEASSFSALTNKTDIYQAGVTMYRMCNGNKIFKQQADYWRKKGEIDDAISDGLFPDRKTYLSHIPNKLRKVINTAMNTDSDKRYRTVIEMINAISSIEENLDWVYNENENRSSVNWTIENDKKTHINKIEVVNNKNIYDIYGTKEKKDTGKVTNNNEWCSKGHITFNEACKIVEKFIKEYKK